MKTALLLTSVSVFRPPPQHKTVLFENTSSLWAETIREKKNNEKAAIKSQKRASQTGNCGSAVLVRNVNEGTLELKEKKTLEIISPSNTASCLLQWLYGELCGC